MRSNRLKDCCGIQHIIARTAGGMVCDRAIESEESCCARDGDVIIPGATISVVGHHIGMGGTPTMSCEDWR